MTHRRLLSLCLTVLVTAIAVLVSGPCAMNAQASPSPWRECYPSLGRFKLVLPGAGWAIIDQLLDRSLDGGDCTAPHLYWTDDNGQTWREITPRHMPTRGIGQIFFLDRLHGWMLSTDALSDEKDARFYLLATEDGGRNWRTLVLKRPMFKLTDEYNFPNQLFFSDSQHGWILWHWQVTHSSRYALLSTNDGGRTWKRLPDLPGPGPFQFTSARDGWMIGGPENPVGITSREYTQLWVTQDGGAHWSPMPVPVPKDSPEQETYLIALRVKDMREGMVAAGVEEGGTGFRYVNCFTHDGGKTWQFSQFDALSAQPSIGDKHIFWSVFHRDTKKATIQMDSNVISFALPIGLSIDGRFLDVDFVDDSNAWASYRDGRAALVLVATTDGGQTARIITPPAAVHAPE